MFHLLLRSLPVEPVFAFARDRFEELRRESEGLVHLKRFGALDDNAFLRFHRVKLRNRCVADQFGAAHEATFFRRNHFLDAFDRRRVPDGTFMRSATIGTSDRRVPSSPSGAVEDRSAQSTNDVFLFLRTGIDVFVNREDARADVVRNASQASTIFIGQVDRVVFRDDRFRRPRRRGRSESMWKFVSTLKDRASRAQGPCPCRCSCSGADGGCPAGCQRGYIA